MLEEFSRSHRIFTIIADGTNGLTPGAILRLGTAEQRQRYLPGLVKGTLRAAFGLTERKGRVRRRGDPHAGSSRAATAG